MATTFPVMRQWSPGIGSWIGLGGSSQTWPFMRLKVQEDLEALPERRALLADHMAAVNRLAACIKATGGIDVLAGLVADEINNGTFRSS